VAAGISEGEGPYRGGNHDWGQRFGLETAALGSDLARNA